MTIALARPTIATARYAKPAFLAFALVLTCVIAVVIYVVPLNANDMLKHLLRFEVRSFWRELHPMFIWTPSPEWRPLQLPFGYLLYRLANGHEHLMFKGLLVASFVGTVWLFVRMLPVRSWFDAVAAAIALLILFAHHSFTGAIEGVYPWGVEIVLVACQVTVLGILLRERTPSSDIVAVAVSVFALALNEKGGAVGATYIVGAILRMPGASIRAAAWTFVGYIVFLVLRFYVFRSLFSAAGGRRAEAGFSSWLFDAVAPVVNFLTSDPQQSYFVFFPRVLVGHPGATVIIVSSLVTTALITVWAIVQRRTSEAGLLVLLVVVLLTSMMFGPFSNKNYIPILALPIYAVATFYALRWLFGVQRGVAAVLACVLFFTWAVRLGGLGYYMAGMAWKYQGEWREAEVWGHAYEHDPRIATPIIERLRAEALSRPIPDPEQALPPFWVALLRGR